MSTANETRRLIMGMAWDFKRAEPERPFADCLRGAWKLSKRMAAHTRKLMRQTRGAKVLQLSPSLIQSPIARAIRRNRYGRVDDFKAAYTTAVLGR